MRNIQPQVEQNFNYKFNRQLLQIEEAIDHHKAMIDLTLGRRIKTRLTALGKKPTWLAGKMGLSDEAVSKWIKGKGDPSLKNLREIAKHLQCSVGYLSGDEEVDDVAEISEMARKMPPDARRYYRQTGAPLVEPNGNEDTGNKKK